ncbi:MAG: YigZ family protein [Campylobacterota bacterium]|nr:YigZ family protein [Campylobacterota bacterium]
MITVREKYEELTEVNRSKFIAYIIPYASFAGYQKQLKESNPKANHVVYAYRYLNEFDQMVEGSSDDGEPKGCAGVPALNVLRGKEMVNVAVLIVRYFGGIKLGTGGMARAYALAVKNLLARAVLIPYEKQIEYLFETSYSDIDRTLHQLKEIGITQYERDFGIDGVKWVIVGSEESILKFKPDGDVNKYIMQYL